MPDLPDENDHLDPPTPDQPARATPDPANPYLTPQAQQAAHVPPAEEQGDVTGGIIPYKNKWALIGYYLGVFSFFIPVIGGIASVILGIMGLRAKKKNPVISGTAHAIIAIVLGILTTIFWLGCGGMIIVGAFAS